MEITIAEQTKIFLLSIALGAALGVCYDVFRILRVGVGHCALAVTIEDLVYALLCAVATFCYQIWMDCGGIRLFILVGEVVGFALYYCTIGSLVMGLAKKIIAIIQWIGKTIHRILISPVCVLFSKTAKIFSKSYQKAAKLAKNNLKNSKTYLKNHRKLLYNLKQQYQKKQAVRNAKKQEPKRK